MPNSPQTLLTSQCSSLWSICLSGATRAAGEWGVVDAQRGRQGVGWGGGVWRGSGEVYTERRVAFVGGTLTVIKDSTAASTWFACLIICHMLNITAISHIRAPPLQQASLRLHGSGGRGRGGRPHAASDADSPFFSIWNDTVALQLRPLRRAQPSPWGSFWAFLHETKKHHIYTSKNWIKYKTELYFEIHPVLLG